MFVPPRCPYPPCPAHAAPRADLFVRFGSYHPKCRPRPCKQSPGRGGARSEAQASAVDQTS